MAPVHDRDARAGAFVAGSVPENYDRLLAPALFEPWAEVLVELAGVADAHAVLDVASGTGAVARLAARRAGRAGRVVASDVSGPMLAVAAARGAGQEAAPIEYVEAPVTALPLAEAEFDVVLCQQGLPFFTDRPAAAAEMRRVLRPGGSVAVSVWAAGHDLEPFAAYTDALEAHGVEPPFPRAYDGASYVMGAQDVERLLSGAGFVDVEVQKLELTVGWPSAVAAASGIFGTPFAPLVNGLPAERREALLADIAERLSDGARDGPVRRPTTSVVARASASG